MAKKKTAKKTYTAHGADRYVLYQMSVQDPAHEVEFFDRVYRDVNRRAPRTLREDFCGTFAVCCEWVKRRGRTALGVDLDPEPLAWGAEHNQSKLTASQQQRITLLQDDVRTVSRQKVDVLAAQNFSFWIFRSRPELLKYFKTARRNLADGGVMVLDMMGGSECFEEDREDIRDIYDADDRKAFTYVWEQHRFNPINHDCTFFIHFRFKDGTQLPRAFRYDWRFWSIPEVRELLAEAGFSKSHVYWEGTDENGEGDGNWQRSESGTADPSWIAYIVAER